ncbi:ATP-binding protein [Paraburkholderia lycopersici]|uniref:Virulence sensor protein BvgS n=1 Tax=Paraburkholderia lycopersici TaxID=416944 RepID=A0A1G6HEY0_9BURK|nr:ATP-binding protein [Paraburkholderia lycopersici]SDB92724.1 Signal transduction histidine kinase [Paraburkholderia lycopersici]
MKPSLNELGPTTHRPFVRRIGWLGTTALAVGGCNQNLLLVTALFVGEGSIPGHGSAAVLLLLAGLLLGYAALPGWIELVMMSPNRVGGVASACAEAFKPYGSMLSTLTGMCYWWGRIPVCGLAALLCATAINRWFLAGVPVPAIACALLGLSTLASLRGIQWVARLAVPVATGSALLALAAIVGPMLTGTADWSRATDLHLTLPFAGWFGTLTSAMSGLYLVGFVAPAFEAAACHAAETLNPERNVPRAMKASAAMAAVYFVGLPLVWLLVPAAGPLGADLGLLMGAAFAPAFGALAKCAAVWFIVFNTLMGALQPLAGASRTLSQLADDGLAPGCLSRRNANDAPVAATLVTAGAAAVFLLADVPVWLVAAANFAYLFGIAMPGIAVWLMRRHEPLALRLYRAPRFTIGLGLAAALAWCGVTVLGLQQFGRAAFLTGLAMAYSGVAIYAWRKWEDRRRAGLTGLAFTLQFRLTGAMLLVLALYGAGYFLAVSQLPPGLVVLRAALEDLFVVVAMLTIMVGIVLPGMIAHSAQEVARVARNLSRGTLRDFSNAMNALGRGDLDAAEAIIDIKPVEARSNDELGELAASFNELQVEVASAALGLAGARQGLREARERLTRANTALQQKFTEQQQLAAELLIAKNAAEISSAAKNRFMARMSHELRTPLNGVIGPVELLLDFEQSAEQHRLLTMIRHSGATLRDLIERILDIAGIEEGLVALNKERFDIVGLVKEAAHPFVLDAEARGLAFHLEIEGLEDAIVWSDSGRIRQIIVNLLSNALKFTGHGGVGLRVNLLSGPGGNGHLRIAVQDTGRGISPDNHERIFMPFAQADESRTRECDGAGVGLFLVRELVVRFGGEIEVTSELGSGATFVVRLPVDLTWAEARLNASPSDDLPMAEPPMIDTVPDIPPAAQDPARPAPPVCACPPEQIGSPPRILLAEDNQVNRAVVVASLGRLGLTAEIAVDGEQAVRVFEQSHFDLILMDCHMPKMDGMAAIAAIRASERAREMPPMPIIAITADLTSANVAQCMAAGASEVLAKPFTFAQFSERVMFRVNAAGSPGDDAASGSSVAVRGGHPAQQDAQIDMQCIDELSDLADGDDGMALAADIVTTFREDGARQMAELNLAISTRTMLQVGRIAHSLKSSSAYVGASGFSALMKEMEMRASANDNDNGTISDLMERAERAFALIDERLSEVVREMT